MKGINPDDSRGVSLVPIISIDSHSRMNYFDNLPSIKNLIH